MEYMASLLESKFFHILVGGVFALFMMYMLLFISFTGIQMILFNIGSFGLLTFNETTNAVYLLTLGIAYLPGGFLGGLYTGYRVKENLKIILLYPALIGSAGLFALEFFTGYITISSVNLQNEILVPLLGAVAGSYLGGYTMNWKEEETAEPSETVEFDAPQVKP